MFSPFDFIIPLICEGSLPRTYADEAINAGLLVSKQVEKSVGKKTYLSFAWRIDKQDGKTMKWLIKFLKKHGAGLLK